MVSATDTLRKKCLYSELFWSVFSPMQKNTDQNNSDTDTFRVVIVSSR